MAMLNQINKITLLTAALLLVCTVPSHTYPDKKEGSYKTYYADGALKAETFYRDGKKDGSHKLYNKDGTLFAETRYKNNQKIYEKTQNQEGNTVERHLKDGQVRRLRVYSRQGELVEEGSFRDNLKHGKQKKFYPNGNIWIVTPYTKGLKHGTEKQYYQTGQLQFICQYKNGGRHGHAKTYGKEGNLKTDQIYIDGKLQKQKS